MKATDLLVVIPALNEEKNLPAVLSALQCTGVPVVVVDDGSRDATARVATEYRAIVVILPENRGKADAIKHSLRFPAQKLLLLDADLVGFACSQALQLKKWAQEVGVARILLKGGRLSTTWSHLLSPVLAGQRIIPKDLLEQFYTTVDVQGFQLEVALEDFFKERGIEVEDLVLEGVGQVMKEEKRGLVRGFVARIKMYRDIVSYKIKKGP